MSLRSPLGVIGALEDGTCDRLVQCEVKLVGTDSLLLLPLVLILPKLISLDSSTLGALARDIDTNPDAGRVLELLNSGELLLYFSGEHITELNQHADQNTRLARMDFLCSLSLVASFRSPEGQPILGSYGHLQRAEIHALLETPSLRLDQVIELVKPIACAGFCSGKEFVSINRSTLAFLAYTGAVTNQVLRHADVASLNQTFGGTTLRRRNREDHRYKLPNAAELQKFHRAQVTWLLRRLQHLSDPRSQSGNQLAKELCRKALELVTTFYQTTDSGRLNDFLERHFEIEPHRLPASATFEDAAYEVLFRSHLQAYTSEHTADLDCVARNGSNDPRTWSRPWQQYRRCRACRFRSLP